MAIFEAENLLTDEAKKAKAKTDAAALIAGDNVKLLQDTGKLSSTEISKLKNPTFSKAAYIEIWGLIKKIYAAAGMTADELKPIDEVIAAINTSIDIDSFVLKTSADTSGSAAKKCKFGLGQIGEASAGLAGITLCKSRAFVVSYKQVDADGIPLIDTKYRRPILIGVTGKGE